jgi:hypothetical protein
MLEEPVASRSRPRLPREYQCHFLGGVRQLRQPLQRHSCIAQTLDAVVMGVPLDQLRLYNPTVILILIHDQYDGTGPLRHLQRAERSTRWENG